MLPPLPQIVHGIYFTVVLYQQHESSPKIIMCSNNLGSSVPLIWADCAKDQREGFFRGLSHWLSEWYYWRHGHVG